MKRLSLVAATIGGLAISSCSDDPDATESARYRVVMENISDTTRFPTPFAPGVWALHNGQEVLFSEGTADRAKGLAALAEDGNPGELAQSLGEDSVVIDSGVFNTPEGAAGAGALLPTQRYAFEFDNDGEATFLSFASMIVQSNDQFVGTEASGIRLPATIGVETVSVEIFDAGTETDEAPGSGPNQAPRQSSANAGAAEGVIRPFTNTTRALPSADKLASVSVAKDGETLTFTVTNVSAASGDLVTPIAPVFFATHSDCFRLFAVGEGAGTAGLESLAEDGSPAALVASHTGAACTGTVGAQPVTNERPEDGPGPALPSESYSFTVTPSAETPNLSIAMMVVQTNDAFIALDETGIALIDAEGAIRDTAQIEAELDHRLAVWDAGTEANQVPGVGADQAPRQAAANTGAVDPVSEVRLYRDATSDLSGESAGGFATLSVTNVDGMPGQFEVTITNRSDETAYPGLLTPVVWAMQDAPEGFFQSGDTASAGLEALAEAGQTETLLAEVGTTAASSGVHAIPSGETDPGPLAAGAAYSFIVQADASARYLSFASMIVPSNDTFITPGAPIALVDASGAPYSDTVLAEATLQAWDAGTEANQAGAGGADQPPRQSSATAGAAEGNAQVRRAQPPLVSYPSPEALLTVTIERLR